jgi:hypothetical protein
MNESSPDHLRKKAREILAAAEQARDAQSRATLARMAASYVQMARQIEDLAAPRAGRWDMQQVQQSQSQDQRKN